MTGDGWEVHDGLPEVVERRLDPVERYGARLTLFGVAILLVAVPFGLLLGQVITDGPATAWDADIADGLHGMVVGRDSVIAALEVTSFLGTSVFLFAVVGIPVAFLAYKERWHLLMFLVVTSLGAGVINAIVKVLVARPRPELDDPISSARGNSFPSGHTMASTACYGALLIAFAALLDDRRRRPAIAFTCLLVGAVGFSRLALGVHYLTDVLGGFVLGLAWLLASVAAWEVWREDRGLRRTAPLEEGVEPEEARDLT